MAPVDDLPNGFNGHTDSQSQPVSNGFLNYGHHTSYEPTQRPLHVLLVGCGPSGIAMAIELFKIPHLTFEIFDKNPDVGGTWLENRYLGAACDVASHAYQYTFASNPDWSSHFSPAAEIFRYFKDVAERYGVLDRVQLDSKVESAHWNEQEGKWHLTISRSNGTEIKEVCGDVFINAGGILNKWKWPDIEGLHSFLGLKIHTADWDTTWDWTDKTIGVIGSGATGIQVVPQLQPKAKNLEIFIRSPTYILPSVGFGVESSTFNEPYTAAEKERFRNDKVFYRKFRKAIEQQMNENFSGSIKDSSAQKDGRQWAENMMRKSIMSKVLQEKLIPSWELGCRRLTPGKPYLDAVQKGNVSICTTSIECIETEGIKTSDGQLHHLDAIVCATGFDTSFTPSFELHGIDNLNLRALWSQRPAEAYMGLAVSGFPNYWTFLGPNTPIANGSLIPCIEWTAKYVSQALCKMQKEQIRTLNIKPSVQNAFNAYTQAVHEDLVWSGSCTSWYKDKVSGKVTAVWPGSSVHFMDVINTPRWEDYEIDYVHGNLFQFMGNGVSQREAKKEDLTYYLDHL